MPVGTNVATVFENLRFRQLEASDAREMLKFHSSNLIVRADVTYMKKMTTYPNWAFGAFEKESGQLVGSILSERMSPRYTQFADDAVRSFVYVSQLAVSSQYRNQGIARILLGALENSRVYPLASQTTDIFLHVMAENIGALRLYRGFGFALTGFFPNMYASDECWDGFEMVKPIFPEKSGRDGDQKEVSAWKCCFGWFSSS